MIALKKCSAVFCNNLNSIIPQEYASNVNMAEFNAGVK